MSETLFHTLDPIYDENSRVLLLGSFPSPLSREQGFYYANPRNRFWQVVESLTNSPPLSTIPQKRAFLLSHGIALWDVLHSCEIKGASDASIRSAVPNDLSPIFGCADIRAVFTTGQAAHKLYVKLLLPIWGADKPLPSTSPANCACGLERLIKEYAQVFDAL